MPQLEEPLPLPPSQRIGFAVVGLGNFTLNQILPRFSSARQCRLTALVSGNAEKARHVAAAYGVADASVYSYETFDRICDNPDVEVVYILLPNTLHREWTQRAAAAGKHVFCEMPMAATVADCEVMIDAVQRAGRQLGIAYRAPFERHNREAIRMIRAGEIGRVHTITGEHGRQLDKQKPADQWRIRRELAGGGSLFDIGIYNLNNACAFTGESPVEVTAAWRASEDPDPVIEVETGIEWTMRFPGGVMASFHSGYNHGNVKRMTIIGADAVLELDPATEYRENRLLVRRPSGTLEPKLGGPNQFSAQLDHFAECVRENRAPMFDGAVGLRDVRVMEAIYEAASTGRPVSLPA